LMYFLNRDTVQSTCLTIFLGQSHCIEGITFHKICVEFKMMRLDLCFSLVHSA